MNSDESVQKAHNAIERWYLKLVNRYAKDLIEEIKDGDIEDDQTLYERIHEDADNAVTYTFDAMNIVIASRNNEAFIEDFGDIVMSDRIEWEKLAFAAFARDLQEAIGDFDDHAPEDD